MINTFLRRSIRTIGGRPLSRSFVLLLCVLSVSRVFGYDPEWKSLNLPTKPSDISGFTCRVEVLNAASEGYLPIRVTATSSVGTFPGDRPIRLTIEPKYGNTPKPKAIYTTNFVLPNGKSTYSETFYIPKYFEGGAFSVVFSDSGGELKSYSANFLISVSNKLKSPQELITVSDWISRLAVIAPDPGMNTGEPWALVPDLRTLESMLEVDNNFLTRTDRLTDAEALNYIKNQSRLTHQFFTADMAHENWLGYESVDVILVALPVLESMKDRHPTRFAAIRDWVSCGGVVWTFGFSEPDALARVFEVATPTPETQLVMTRRGSTHPIDRGLLSYTAGNRSSILQRVIDPYGAGYYYTANQKFEDDPLAKFQNPEDPAHPFTKTLQANEYKEMMLQVPVEAGIVVGLMENDPFPGSLQKWFLVKQLSGANQHFEFRRGFSITRGTTSYWLWLLNNVARPPVYAFLGLFTIFVLLVGPIAYHFTRRAGRAYLMFAIAPVLATITTAMLFGYGFIADGFGAKARIRQITMVDGQSGRASEFSRATYFTAFRPSSGLQFSSEAAVYPVELMEDLVNIDYSPVVRYDRSVDVTDSKQIFRGEFLPSRTQSQFLSYQPVRKRTGLSILFDESQKQWSVKNDFTATIQTAVIRLPDGSYSILSQPLPADATVKISVSETNASLQKLRELYRLHQPENPIGYSAASVNQRGYNWYTYSNAIAILNTQRPNYVDAGDEQGIYESRLRRYLFDMNQLPVSWFAAILDVDQAMSAASGAKVLESVHYAIGSLNLSAVKHISFTPVSEPNVTTDPSQPGQSPPAKVDEPEVPSDPAQAEDANAGASEIEPQNADEATSDDQQRTEGNQR